ncbi:MAG: PA2928 family protein [Gemmatimonadaceae bacterium]
MNEFRRAPNRNWWIPTMILAGVVLGGVAMFLRNPSSRTFNGFEMHGGPVVVNRATAPMVLMLTSHWETHSITTGRRATAANNYGDLHWDVFAFDAKDLSQKWTSRLATVRHAQRDIEAMILGLSHNTLWVMADGLMGVSMTDGKVIGDAASIEQANPQLRGLMPSTRRQMYFDNGLVLIAADGRRWRVDNETLRATMDTSSIPVRVSIMGVPVPRASDSMNVLPVAVTSQTHSFKSRGYVVGDTWYGMMHPSEIELQRRDPHTQNFSSGIRYRLWRSPLRDTLDRMRQPARLPLDFAPLAASPEFLNGGLLTAPDTRGRDGVIGIANPTRFLVLHEDRIDAAAKQTLTCITLEGRVCWNAPLDMRTATSFSLLTKGSAQDWALILTGTAKPQPGDQMVDDAGDDMPVLARVDISSGKVTRFRFADVDFAAMDKALTPYRTRAQ